MHLAQKFLGVFLFSSVVFAASLTNQVTITTDAKYRYIKSNGVPSVYGQFPNSHNPNTILPQNYIFKVPVDPQLATKATALQGFMDFGVAIDGVPFDPGTAEFWQNNPNWRYEALSGKINLGMDSNNAHVQPGGEYHYHGVPTYLVAGQSSSQHSKLVGYAADGFPIYILYGYSNATNPGSGITELQSSYKLRTGARPAGTSGPGGTYDGTFTQDYVYAAGTGDLDECNGRFGITPDFPQGTYAYFISTAFPIVPRCFKGTPDASFNKSGQGSGSMGRGGPPGGPGGMSGQRPPPPPR